MKLQQTLRQYADQSAINADRVNEIATYKELVLQLEQQIETSEQVIANLKD